MNTARHFRVFPGQSVHSAALAELVLCLNRLGYRGDYSFEVFNDDYQQMPLPTMAARTHARTRTHAHTQRLTMLLAEELLKRSAPLPNEMRLQRKWRP